MPKLLTLFVTVVALTIPLLIWSMIVMLGGLQ